MIIEYLKFTQQKGYQQHKVSLTINKHPVHLTSIMSRSCYYHPDNILHNFCANTECALPLCPKCISIHLNQSSQKHHIQSLSETHDMIRQQLDTSIEAIQHNLNIIKNGQFTPEFCLKEYTEIIEKYRQEAIAQINQHYDYIKRELFEELKSKYTCHLTALVAPLQDNLIELKNTRKNLEQKPIESLIKVVSQQTIFHVEKMLQRLSEKKQDFKMELPRLQGIDGNKLKIVPGGLQRLLVKNQQRSPQKNLERSRMRSTRRYEGEQIDRISMLEAQLYHLRH